MRRFFAGSCIHINEHPEAKGISMYPKHSTTSTTRDGNRFTEVHHEVHHEVHYENQPFFRTGRPKPVNRNGFNRQTEMPDPKNSLVILNDYLEPLVPENTQIRDNLKTLIQVINLFHLPVIMTYGSLGLSDASLIPEWRKLHSKPVIISRTTVNPWDDSCFTGTIRQAGKRNLFWAGAIAEISLTLPAATAVQHGYTSYALMDVSCSHTAGGIWMVSQQLQSAGVLLTNVLEAAARMQKDWRMPAGRQLEIILQEYLNRQIE
jgi:hypothetical protein